MTEFGLDEVPVLDDTAVVERVGHEAIVWAEGRTMPSVLDPLATVMLDVIDGSASAGELIGDVVEVIGLDPATAERQVSRSLVAIGAAGLLRNQPLTSDGQRDILVLPGST